jgi:dipeptidyl aminopeptidase/acylaminoacyl peptidase
LLKYSKGFFKLRDVNSFSFCRWQDFPNSSGHPDSKTCLFFVFSPANQTKPTVLMARNLTLLLLILFLYPATAQSQDVPENLTLQEIFHEPVIPGIRPSFSFFSGDQSRMFISWNDSSYYETGLYSVDLAGDLDIRDEDDETPRPIHSPDGNRMAYTDDSTIFIANSDGSNEKKIVSTQENEYGLTWSPDGTKLAFIRSGDVWVSKVDRPGIIQVTKKEDNAPNFSISAWAGNKKLVVSQADHSESRTIYFPEYVDDFVIPGETTRGIPEVSVFVASLDTTALDTLVTGYHRSSVIASSSGRYVAIDYMDTALKQRDLIVFDLRNESRTVVFRDSTDGWLHHTYASFAPDSDKLLFLSEQSGWNHIYTVSADGTGLTQHTSGDFYVPWARWADNNTIIFSGNEEEYGERHIYRLDVSASNIQKLTEETAYRYQFQLTPDRSKLIYAKTFFNRPFDLFKMDLNNPGEEIRLTNSVPDRFYEYNWQEENYLRFKGRDGEIGLSMSVLYPKDFDASQSYPVVVFAHGAGSLQNVYKGWSNNYWREYMFHQYLLNHGYIVVEVDFRHSTGYGRKFREDVTNWMGKYETIDIVDGLDWLQEDCGCLDLENVGIYGGSYGGFMALYALTDKPDRFHAGAALRKVTNWRNYYYANPWYTLPRLGDPEVVPEHYDRSSPLTYAGELERPALLLHGLIDDNVGSQHAFQYAEELIQSGNTNFEMVIYPGERHGFTSPHSWFDEYLRIFEFFEEHLK